MRIRRVMHRSLAVGWAGILGWVMVPGVAAGARAEEEGVDQAPALGRARGEEGLGQEELAPEEREALEAPAASTVGGASKDGYDQFECYKEPWKCESPIKCKFPDDADINDCFTVRCGTGSCNVCPEYFGNIAIKSWCSYNCRKGDQTVANAVVFKTRFPLQAFDKPYCLKNGKIYQEAKQIWPR